MRKTLWQWEGAACRKADSLLQGSWVVINGVTSQVVIAINVAILQVTSTYSPNYDYPRASSFVSFGVVQESEVAAVLCRRLSPAQPCGFTHSLHSSAPCRFWEGHSDTP